MFPKMIYVLWIWITPGRRTRESNKEGKEDTPATIQLKILFVIPYSLSIINKDNIFKSMNDAMLVAENIHKKKSKLQNE